MHKRLLACAIMGAASLIGATTYASAEETRAQHREWMRKFGGPGGSLNGEISPQDTMVYRIDLSGCKSGARIVDQDRPRRAEDCSL